MNTMLKDADNVYVECESMRKERTKLVNQCSTMESEVRMMKITNILKCRLVQLKLQVFISEMIDDDNGFRFAKPTGFGPNGHEISTNFPYSCNFGEC